MGAVMNVLAVVVPVAAAMLLGYVAQRRGIVSGAAIDGIKALVVNFTLPAVLIGAFYTAELNLDFVTIVAVMIGACLAGLGTGMLLRRVFPSLGSLLPFLTTGFEAGMMGYGLYAMLFPPEELRFFAMVDFGQVLFVFTLYMALLNLKQGSTLSATVKGMLTSPTFLAIMLGLLLSLTGLGIRLQQSAAGVVFDALLQYISAPTGVLMLFVVGSTLVLDRKNAGKAFLTLAVRTGIMLVLCSVCLLILHRVMAVPPPLLWAVVLMFSLPAPFVLPIYSNDREQSAYLASTLSISSLFSLLLFALISALR